MIPTRQTADLQSFVLQGQEHLQALQGILGSDEPPEQGALQQLTHMTRSLRGSASLLGLDVFQSFLGRLFSLLEDVESSEVPWSARLEVMLDEAHRCASAYLQMLENGGTRPRVDALQRVEERLASWRRETTRRFETPVGRDDPQRVASQSDVSDRLLRDLDALLAQARALVDRVTTVCGASPVPAAVLTRARELAALGDSMAAPDASPPVAPAFEDGLRNHCEGVLRSLVEAAAQEVLDEARELGTRLALRATGSLGEVDDELGGALLEILRNLWSDSLQAQKGAEAEVDCIVRDDEDRIVVDVRDPAIGNVGPLGEDDVLGRYAGLRRSRPLVESLQGLVWVDAREASGCRFRVALPRHTEPYAALALHVGQHLVALPASAIEAMHPAAAVRVLQDGAGTVADVAGVRLPLLQLAFALQDESFEEREHELVVVVGSFERRAALLASGPCTAVHGPVAPKRRGPWLGTLTDATGSMPLLDVAALLGRRRLTVAPRETPSEPVPEAGPTVLVVSSNAAERQRFTSLLGDSGSRTLVAQSANEAWELLGRERVDVLICDLRLPEMNAQRLAELRRQTGQHAEVPVLLVLSQVGEQSHLVVRQLGARGCVGAPVAREELVRVVRECTGAA